MLGLPPAQQNEISALTLLALCGLKEEENWTNATRKSLKISKYIMAFVNENYKKEQSYVPQYAGNLQMADASPVLAGTFVIITRIILLYL
ncbi:hypothetical protein [Phocaeicola sp.]